MKKFLSMLLTFAMLITLLPAVGVFAKYDASTAEVMAFTSPDVSCQPGDTIEVKLNFKSGWNTLSSGAVGCKYDSEYLEYDTTAYETNVVWNNKFERVDTGSYWAENFKALALLFMAHEEEYPTTLSENETIVTVKFKVKDTVTDYTETKVTFSCDKADFNTTATLLDSGIVYSAEDNGYESDTIKTSFTDAVSTVKIGTPATETKKELKNFSSANSELMANANAGQAYWQIVPVSLAGTSANSYEYNISNKLTFDTQELAEAELEKADSYWSAEGYVGKARKGTSLFNNYPTIADVYTGTGKRIDHPFPFTVNNTNVCNIMDGNAYVISKNKGVEFPGNIGVDDDYLEFEATASGTMYFIPLNNTLSTLGTYPGGSDKGWTKVASGKKIANSEGAWYKHFDVAEGKSTVKVTVPAFGLTEDAFKTAFNKDKADKEWVSDSPGYVWVFDSDEPEKDSTTTLSGVSYSIDGTAGSTSFTEGTYEYTIDSGKDYTGSVELTFTKDDDKQTITGDTTVTLTNGNGVANITVTAEDGSTQAYKLTFSYTAPADEKKTISNVVCADSNVSDSSVYRLIPGRVDGSYSLLNDAENPNDQFAAANTYWSKYGENAYLGANPWKGYPGIYSSKVDNPLNFNVNNTMTSVLDGESYVIKKGKSDNVGDITRNDGSVTVANKGVLGTDADYLTFKVNASGTMYVMPNAAKYYPAGEAAEYKQIDGTIGGGVVWAKHFEVAEGSGTVTVTVPALGLIDVQIAGSTNGSGVINSDTDKRVQNGVYYVWTFDADAEKDENATKQITEITSSNSDITQNVRNGKAAWKMIPPKVEGTYDLTGSSGKTYATHALATEQITNATNYWAKKGYGTNVVQGACFWTGYPLVRGNDTDTYYIDLPVSFGSADKSVLNGDSWVIPIGKGHNITRGTDDKGNATITDKGIYGEDANYLSFKVNASGTMYVIPNVSVYPGGESAGYKKSSVSIAGAAWAKHFDVPEGSDTVTVTVPALNLTDAQINTALGNTTNVRFYNTPGFIWVFDDTTNVDLSGVSFTVNGSKTDVTFEDGKYEYEVSTLPYTGDVDLTFTKKADKQTITGDSKVTLTNGNGNAEFTVTSADGTKSQVFKITFKCESYKIVNAAKSCGVPWVLYTYGAEQGNKEYWAVTDGLVIGTSFQYTNRANTTSGSANLNGATYIRTPKYETNTAYDTIEVFDQSGIAGGNISFTKKTGDADPVTVTGRENGAFDGQNPDEHSGFRVVKDSAVAKNQAFFNGNYDGTNGTWWATFVPTSDCTVIIGDNVDHGYPNLDKTLWKNNTVYNYNGGAHRTYVRHYKAGETVQIPNYGVFDDLTDDTQIVYTYYDNTGAQQTFTTTKGNNYINWDDLTLAIVWDDKAIESGAADIKVDGTTISGFKADKLAYDYVIPYGTESVMVDVTVADENTAKATGAGSYKAGDTATIVVTAGDKTTTTTYTITFTQEEPKTMYQVKATAVGDGTISATYGEVKNEDWQASKTEQFELGARIKLTAVAGGDAEFLYWKDVTTGRIVSYNKEYTFDVGTANDVVAMFKDTDSYTVKFMDMNNRVLAEGTTASDITVPANPYILGYTFGGWKIGSETTSYKASDVIAANTFKNDTVIQAIQTLEETKYAVTFENVTGCESGEYKYNTKLTAAHTEAPASKIFSHWERDGKVVSYEDTYTFYVGNYATTVKAVFVEDTETVKKAATVTMAEPTIVSGNKISFMAERNVPEGCTVIESGIILKKDAQTEITLDSEAIIKATSANHANYGAYTVRKANVSVGETWSAVSYLIYTDAEGNVQTIYSNVVSKTME